jgi:hypothetical protein
MNQDYKIALERIEKSPLKKFQSAEDKLELVTPKGGIYEIDLNKLGGIYEIAAAESRVFNTRTIRQPVE